MVKETSWRENVADGIKETRWTTGWMEKWTKKQGREGRQDRMTQKVATREPDPNCDRQVDRE